MRVVAALLLALVVAVPALADEPAPYVRTCSSSAHGDLGRGWRERAVVAGHIAFLGGTGSRSAVQRYGPGTARPLKVLVVVDANAAPTVTIAPRSRAHAALGYNRIRHNGTGVPLADGTQSVLFRACRPVSSREPWNRGHAVSRLLPRRGRPLRARRHRDAGEGAPPEAQLRRTLQLTGSDAGLDQRQQVIEVGHRVVRDPREGDAVGERAEELGDHVDRHVVPDDAS